MGAQPMSRAKDQSISAGSGARQGRRSEGRSRDLKHRMILEAAGACFFKLGYEGTSIGSIVERTGGSIASIYAIFGSKRGLFEAFIRDRAQRLNVSIAYQGRPQGPRYELTYLASQLLDRATRPDWLDLVRLIDRKSTRLNSSHYCAYRMPSSA